MADPTTKSIPSGTYHHFKGGVYKVLFVATEESTGNPIVVYQNSKGQPWTRPLENFTEIVSRDGYEGPRFYRVGD